LTIGRIEDILLVLKAKGLIRETADDPPGFLPGRDLDRIRLEDVYEAVRSRAGGAAAITSVDAAVRVVEEVDEAIDNRLGSRTLKDMVRAAASPEKERRAA
jgi:DNA-binding IscR family transcriptional regulator